MRNKKVLLGLGFIGLAGLTALGYSVQKKVNERQTADSIKEIREFFSQQGKIQVLYIKSYESSDDCLVGGLVFEDQRVLDFTYKNGKITYSEVADD